MVGSQENIVLSALMMELWRANLDLILRTAGDPSSDPRSTNFIFEVDLLQYPSIGRVETLARDHTSRPNGHTNGCNASDSIVQVSRPLSIRVKSIATGSHCPCSASPGLCAKGDRQAVFRTFLEKIQHESSPRYTPSEIHARQLIQRPETIMDC
jgi:hypothetical protein